jgi:hypothetical protein
LALSEGSVEFDMLHSIGGIQATYRMRLNLDIFGLPYLQKTDGQFRIWNIDKEILSVRRNTGYECTFNNIIIGIVLI